MAFSFDLGAAVAIASAVAMAVLGLIVLRLDAERGAALTFAAFVLAWAAEIIAANVTVLFSDPPVLYAAALGFQALLYVACVPLVVFAVGYPPSDEALVSRRTAAALVGIPALAGLVAMAVDPSLYVASATAEEGVGGLTYGPLSGVASTAFSGAFLVGIGVIGYRLHGSQRPEQRSRLALLLAAFTTYVSYQAGLLFPWLGPWRETFLSARGPVGYWTIAVLLGLAFLSVVGVFVWASSDRSLPWRRLVLVTAAVPLTVTTAHVFLTPSGGLGVNLVGFWRLGMVAILAYALARFRLFDLEVHLRDAVPVAAYVGLVLVGWGLVWGGFGEAFGRPLWTGVAATVGVAMCAWPSVSLTEELLDRHAGYLDEPDYLYRRKVEVYRSALEDARAKGLGTDEEQRFLADLRDRLEISEDEHRALVAVLDDGEGASPADRWEQRFTVREELGRGSLGRALLARDERLDRDVVLKEATGSWLFDESGRELFLQEARLAAQLNHPHVVQVFEVLVDRDPPTLVLEYVPGGSLDRRIETEGPLDPVPALDLLDQVLAGLQALHEQDIVHRDLKPGNVLVTSEGEAKVTDLGVARPPEHADMDATLPASDDQPGTLVSMSPEQVRGEPVDARTDVYAAGATLYFALTGDHYLEDVRADSLGLRERICEEEPALDRERVPEPLREVLARALAKDPDDRYSTAERMREALAEARAELGEPRPSPRR